jgi:hypothetical protein
MRIEDLKKELGQSWATLNEVGKGLVNWSYLWDPTSAEPSRGEQTPHKAPNREDFVERLAHHAGRSPISMINDNNGKARRQGEQYCIGVAEIID